MKNTCYKKMLKRYDTIIVYNRRSWFHRLVLRITSQKAGHVALYVGKGEIIEASGAGIKQKKLKNYDKHCSIYIARPILIESKQRLDLYCRSVIGQKYAYLQLILYAIKYIFKIRRVPDVSKNALVCSEFVADAYYAGGIDIKKGYEAHEITPGDIMVSPALYLIVNCDIKMNPTDG